MPEIQRTLTIRAEPIRKILTGSKKWEMRSRPTRIRERIGLSVKGAGLIVGTCIISDCVGPLTFDQVRRNVAKMGLSKAQLREHLSWWRAETKKGRVYAWVLSNVRRFKTPVRFQNPSGAVVFSRVPPRVARKLR